MEFLNLIETLQSERADIQALYGDAGRAVRTRESNAAYNKRLVGTIQFLDEVMRGKRPAHHLREALTTSDFPQLFGDVIDRQVLASYSEWPVAWPTFCKRATVRDFRTVKRFRVDGSEGVLTAVAEQAPYPISTLADSEYTYTVAKYGRRLPFSWEAIINDDLQALRDIPERFGRAARRSEDKFATQLIADSNGPHATMFAAGNRNLITSTYGAGSNNPALSIIGVQDGFKVLGNQVDTDGEPILIDAVVLMVPPALEVTARNILNALSIEVGASTDAQRIQVANWMKNRTTLVVNPYLPIVSTTNGNTSWYLFASPANGRPAVEMGFLAGHEQPEIFMKEANARRVGGGPADPLMGDFDRDSIEYKIRHVFGGARMDPKMAVASNGSGS